MCVWCMLALAVVHKGRENLREVRNCSREKNRKWQSVTSGETSGEKSRGVGVCGVHKALKDSCPPLKALCSVTVCDTVLLTKQNSGSEFEVL